MSRIEELEKRLDADPNSRMFVQLAEEYRKAGLLDNAVEICEEGLKKHPQYPSARVALGRALLESESLSRAAEEFETVLAQVPDNILANKFLGETYHRMGSLDEALQKYQIAQTLAPDDAELEEKIQAARDESAGEAPASEPPPEVVTPPPEPSTELAGSQLPQPPPLFDVPASTDSLPEPPPLVQAARESTFVDSPAASVEPPAEAPLPAPPPAEAPPPALPAEALPPAPPAEALPPVPPAEAPPPVPPSETFFKGESAVPEETEAEPEPEPDLTPIPLVDVDEPMVLEGPAYSAAENAAERTESQTGTAPTVEPSEAAPEGEQLFAQAEDEPPLTPGPALPTIEEPPPAPFEPALAAGPADDVATPPSPEPPVVPELDEIETPTMAELYASQGHLDRAVAVYRNLLVRTPNETQYRERIEELEMLANAAALPKAPAARDLSREAGEDGLSAETRKRTIGVLSEWLDAIRKSREA